jgi:hypothetical protein
VFINVITNLNLVNIYYKNATATYIYLTVEFLEYQQTDKITGYNRMSLIS